MNQNPIAIYPVTIYTDGSCLKNPGGPGGWAAVILADGQRQEISGGVRSTTNNRMELLAVIKALSEVDIGSSVLVITDSVYVVYSIRRVGRLRRRTVFANPDLLERLGDACKSRKVRVTQILGHNGTPENTRADLLAGMAARSGELGIDAGFETKPRFSPMKTQDPVRSVYKPRVEQLIFACDAH